MDSASMNKGAAFFGKAALFCALQSWQIGSVMNINKSSSCKYMAAGHT